MKQKTLFILWGAAFTVCAALGFIPEPEGAVKYLLTAVAAAFFVPGFVLLHRASRDKDRQTLALIRNLSAWSLGLTLALLVGNFLSVLGSETVGMILNVILTIVSSPMMCSGYWALSLFLWAYLLIAAMSHLRKK